MPMYRIYMGQAVVLQDLNYANHVSNRKATSGALHVQIVLGATAFNTAHQGGGVSLAQQAAGPFPVAGVLNAGTLFM